MGTLFIKWETEVQRSKVTSTFSKKQRQDSNSDLLRLGPASTTWLHPLVWVLFSEEPAPLCAITSCPMLRVGEEKDLGTGPLDLVSVWNLEQTSVWWSRSLVISSLVALLAFCGGSSVTRAWGSLELAQGMVKQAPPSCIMERSRCYSRREPGWYSGECRHSPVGKLS